ncbi:MAG: PRC-barrel domain-containing protein [Gemmataceae bacterium]
MKKLLLTPLVAFLMVVGVAQAQVNVQVLPGKGVQIQPGNGQNAPNIQIQPGKGVQVNPSPNNNQNPNVQVNPNQNPNVQANPNPQVQSNTQVQGNVQVQPNNQQLQAWRAKQIIGAKVQLSGNAMAGTVDDIVFTDDGQVEYLLVSHNGKMVTVPWQAAKFNVGQQTATIELTQQQYQAIPTYTAESYPQFFAPQYREQVYRSYNLRPGQIRRLERRGQLP